MKNFKYYLSILGLILLGSCDDYLDINQNPNQALYPSLLPSELLTGAQTNTYIIQTQDMNQLGNVLMNSWNANLNKYGTGYTKQTQLIIDNTLGANIWNGGYRGISNFSQIINNFGSNPKYVYSVAASKICLAHYMQTIVDLYGNAPYSKAFLGAANTTPSYDDDQVIYRSLISSLESARASILNATAAAEDITPYDAMLAGNMSSWVQFANTIELRMLLRMSKSTGAVAAYRDSKINALAAEMTLNGYSFLSTDVHINPGYSTTSDDALNPFYNLFGLNAAGTVATTGFDYVTSSGHAYRAMKTSLVYPTANPSTVVDATSSIPGLNYANITDPRYARIFRNGTGQTIGRAITQGSPLVDTYPPGQTLGIPSRIGLGVYNPNSQASPFTSVTQAAVLDGYVMTASESYLLQAEAALTTINPSFAPLASIAGAGSVNFANGVTASFNYFTAAGAAGYITAVNALPYYGWTGTDTQKLHAIMYQKWISLMGVNGIQSFIDYNKTGFPITPLSTDASKPRKPYRLFYSSTEYSANSSNVPSLSDVDLFTITAKSPFWLQGDPPLGN